ncbi:MAG: hypothetical protein ABI589_07875 [Burkholderiales bacterium]
MDISPIGIVILIASSIGSFAFGRWWSRGRRQKKQERERLEREAAQSRQVRRARERQRRR